MTVTNLFLENTFGRDLKHVFHLKTKFVPHSMSDAPPKFKTRNYNSLEIPPRAIKKERVDGYRGSFTRTALFNMLITTFKMSLYKVKLDAKFH